MKGALATSGYRIAQLVPGERARKLRGRRYEVDLLSEESLATLYALLSDHEGQGVGCLINLMPLGAPFNCTDTYDGPAARQLAQGMFNLLKCFEDELRESASRGGGWILNFTSLDGAFGLGREGALPVAQAGTLGLMKAVAKEWPEVQVKNIDLHLGLDPALLFSHVFEEVTSPDGAVEVGIREAGRSHIRLVPAPVALEDLSPLALNRESVILVTGGAYGITAEVTRQLAAEAHPRLVLVGRSPRPAEEAAATAPLHEVGALRSYLIRTMRADDPTVTPVVIEHTLQRILKERRIRDTLHVLEQEAEALAYYSVDVRDEEAFGDVIDEVYRTWGRIDGVIHGAGIIEDKRLRDKTADSFARVFDTKVQGALTLAKRLRPASLQFLAFFSSVAGRFGNAGQTDYSAANEVLNKLAAHLDACWPARVVSVNWGPWDGGMVSDTLRRMYAARGLHLIPPEMGAARFMQEIRVNGAGVPEVIISCSVQQMVADGKREKS